MEKTAWISATTVPRLDSMHGEEEEDEAEVVACLDLLGELSNAGDACVNGELEFGHGGEKGEEELGQRSVSSRGARGAWLPF